MPGEKQTDRRISAEVFLADFLSQALFQPGLHFFQFGLGAAVMKTVILAFIFWKIIRESQNGMGWEGS